MSNASHFATMSDSAHRYTGNLRVDGAQIHYEVCGQGPAIIFAHGLGGNPMSWWQQVGHFQQGYTCVTFAHRGFAPSTADDPRPDPQRFADDLAALIDHLELGQVYLVGQSMGGWTVVEYSLRYPQRVRGIVLSATTGTINPDQLCSLDRSAMAAWMQSAEHALAQCRSQRVHPAAGLTMANEQPELHLLYQHIDEQARGLDKEALRSQLLAMRVRAPAELAATGIPLLLVSPRGDIVIPPPALKALASEIPEAQLIELPNCGHSPYFERAQAFNRALEAFLECTAGQITSAD